MQRACGSPRGIQGKRLHRDDSAPSPRSPAWVWEAGKTHNKALAPGVMNTPDRQSPVIGCSQPGLHWLMAARVFILEVVASELRPHEGGSMKLAAAEE